MSAKLTPRRVMFLTLGVIGVGILLTLGLPFLSEPTHLEPVDVAGVSAGTLNSSGIPVPMTGDITVCNMETYEPHFPFSDFRKGRAYAKSSAFRLMVQQQLPEGSYRISVKNSLGALLLPLQKVSPQLYVSPPIIILQSHANSAYFFGYGVLKQEAGTRDTLNIEVERVVRGPEKKPAPPQH